MAAISPLSATPNPPIPFAILRNAHEGLRSGIKDLAELVSNPPFFVTAWRNFKRAHAVHALMEDANVFKLLDSVSDGQVTKEKIPEEHGIDHDNIEKVDHVLAASDPINTAALAAAFEQWRAFFLQHLEHEEKIMAPLTGKTGSTPDARAISAHENMVLPADKRNSVEFEFFIGWIVSRLNQRGSTANPPIVAVRVFVHGLKVSSNPVQWGRFLPIVKANCSPEIYNEMKTSYFIESHVGLQPVR